MHGATFVGFDICHRMAILQIIILHDLDLFEGPKFETLKSLIWLELAQKCMERLLQILILAIEWRHCKNCTT